MDAFRKRARPPGQEMSNKPPGQETLTEEKPAPKTETKESEPEDDTTVPATETDTEETTESEESTATPSESKETAPAKASGKKTSPWRVVDQFKAKVASLEKELAESKGKLGKPGEPPPEITERLSKAETRVKELEEEIRFTNYQKSGEFQDQYQKPYEAAWARAVKELSEVTVTDGAGNVRPATAEDMLTLVNLPLGKAREQANAMFGEFANDAMGHRKAIKELFDKQQEALQQAKSKADEWEKTRQETATKLHADIDKQVGEIWAKANTDATTDSKYGQYFTPRENDPDWNQRLAKGFELVDKAFTDANPRDPRLTPDQRKTIVERHAAVRNRAAAFGPLRNENERLTKRLAEVEKELSEYKATEAPQAGGTRPAPKTPTATNDPWAAVREGLRKRARPSVI